VKISAGPHWANQYRPTAPATPLPGSSSRAARSSALDLANRLGLSAAGIRRHLDALVADGLLTECESKRPVTRARATGPDVRRHRCRARRVPPRVRRAGHHGIALPAFATGDDGVMPSPSTGPTSSSATSRPACLRPAPTRRARALALALRRTVTRLASKRSGAGVDGVQICQHHCPIADVAQEFPSCAKPRRARSSGCSVPMCNASRRSLTATGSARRTSRSRLPGSERTWRLRCKSVQPAQTGSRK